MGGGSGAPVRRNALDGVLLVQAVHLHLHLVGKVGVLKLLRRVVELVRQVYDVLLLHQLPHDARAVPENAARRLRTKSTNHPSRSGDAGEISVVRHKHELGIL